MEWRRRRIVIAVCAGALLYAPEAAAHGLHDAAGFRLAPHLVGSLLLIAALYGIGVARLWRRAGGGAGIARWRAALFAGGWLMLVVALVSPIDALAEQLASVHMIQHLLLMLVAAPMMVAGAPALAALWALPRRLRAPVAARWRGARPMQATWLALSQPLLAWVIYAVVLWAWHVPVLYEAALVNPWIHDLQHVLFFGSAALVWWLILNPMGGLRLSGGAGVLYLFTTALHAMALGVFMTLSPAAWYPTYVATAEAWGLTALQDQQIAGVIMWMPACLVYVILAGLVFYVWLRRTETDTLRLERVLAGDGAARGEIDVLLAQAEEEPAP